MNNHIVIRILACACTFAAALARPIYAVPAAPAVAGPAPENEASVVSFPDGSLKIFTMVKGERCISVASTDSGKTWGSPKDEFAVPKTGTQTACARLDRDGEAHVLFLVGRGVGNRKHGVDLFYDVFHARTFDRGGRWSEPKRIFEGYVGALRGFTVLENGRLVAAFAEWIGTRPADAPTGKNEVVVMFSDDGGTSWTQSSDRLKCPSPSDSLGLGGVEPAVIQLKDGRLWMLIRTATGFLYESFSTDAGATWTPTQPSRFTSSESPACLLRLYDGRLLLIWNNCVRVPFHEGKRVYSGRDVIHAAISGNDGVSWRGFREIYADPKRNERPPLTGDRGTAYPSAAQATDGTIVVITGQGETRRAIVRVDPAWLEETRRADDFANGLDGWMVFKNIGPVERYFRNRVIGPALVDNPTGDERGDTRGPRALHVRRPDAEAGDGASWNVPLSRKGTVDLHVTIPRDGAGGTIALQDRFYEPADDIGESTALFLLPLAPDARLGDGAVLEPDRRHQLKLTWDLDKGTCGVLLNGKPATALRAQSNTTNGVCYVRLRSNPPQPNPKGFFVDSISMTAEAPTTSAQPLGRKP
jgi:hypothetical protein